MIGQLITSFLQGKASPTMTSTIFSPYVDRVMEESKTKYYKGLVGEAPATNRGRGSHKGIPQNNKGRANTVGVWARLLRVANDLLPYNIRPIKARRYRIRGGYGVRAELYWLKMTWRSHHRPKLVRAIKKLQLW